MLGCVFDPRTHQQGVYHIIGGKGRGGRAHLQGVRVEIRDETREGRRIGVKQLQVHGMASPGRRADILRTRSSHGSSDWRGG